VRIALIMVAGAAGAAARYGLTVAVQAWLAGAGSRSALGAFGPSFPLATLLINVLGTLLLSALTTLFLEGVVSAEARLALGTGFLGAFTTFSTFQLDLETLLARGEWGSAAAYLAGNLVVGFAAVFAGRALALALLGGAAR
jgi:CrcB protein